MPVVVVVAAATLAEAALEAVTLAELTSAALAVPVLAAFAEADFVQPRIGMGALILPVEVSADQPERSDTTTETAARLLLGHTNSADGETNR
jgi:hypothetical protein